MKNKLKFIGLFVLLIFIIFIIVIYVKNDKKVAILGYHSVLPEKLNTDNNEMIMDAEKFEKQLKILKKLGYKTLSLEEFNCWKNKKCKKPHKSVLITFDDGYYDNYKYAFDILKKYDMNAVVFVIGDNLSSEGFLDIETINISKEKYPNIEFASHSCNLHYRSDKKYNEVDEDIKKMDTILETNYYAYPFGDYTEEYIQALKDNGYKNAFTFGPGKEHRKADIKDDNFKIPRLNMSSSIPMYKFILRMILPI